ncbi:hypothetical protein B0H19DRAFT_1171829 [Mycena capillaripes]|nr:hypothetical protein B0H19DRAFT_1171829 [Mycena capillaripes]
MDSGTAFSSEYDLQIISYVDVACLTLLTYDTLLNLSQEHRHIWKAKWGLIKCLYLWSRYGSFVDTTIAVLRRVDINVNLDPFLCNTLSTFDTIFGGFGIGITEIILMVRTYALYEGSKRLLGFFSALWLSLSAVCIWAVINWVESDKLALVPKISCDVRSSSNIPLVCFISLLAGETVIVLLTLWKGLRTFSVTGSVLSSSHIARSFYRDGIMFYLIMLLVWIVVVVIQSVAHVISCLFSCA